MVLGFCVVDCIDNWLSVILVFYIFVLIFLYDYIVVVGLLWCVRIFVFRYGILDRGNYVVLCVVVVGDDVS